MLIGISTIPSIPVKNNELIKIWTLQINAKSKYNFLMKVII